MRVNRNLLIFLAAVVVVIAGLLLLQSRSSSPSNPIRTISPAEYQSQFGNTNAAHLLLDVRTPQEYSSGHIAGAVNIPVETLQSRLSEVQRDKPVVVYCHSGARATQAAQILANAGYTDIRNLGGITAWVAQGFPIQ